MPHLPRITLLLAALLSQLCPQGANAMASPWTLLPALRDHNPECVNGARLPAYWSISDLSVDYATGGEAEEVAFTLGESQRKAGSLVTCRDNKIGPGFRCKGQGEGVVISLRVPQWSEGGEVVVVVGISEPRAACGARGLEILVEGEVEVRVDCPGSVAGTRKSCVSRSREVKTVDGVVAVQGPKGLGREKFVKVKTQGVRNPWGSIAKKLVGGGKGGKKKMSPLLVELSRGAVAEKKGERKSEEEEVMSEKDLIDAMEDKLCSPSCLGETTPAPESGVQWTNGKKDIQAELRKRRPPSLGRGKPMMW